VLPVEICLDVKYQNNPHDPIVTDIQRKIPKQSRNFDFLEGKMRTIFRKATT
jgi:hypothetical protein